MPSKSSSTAGNTTTGDGQEWPAPEIRVEAQTGTVRLTRSLGEGIAPIVMGAKNIRPSSSGGTQATVMIAHAGAVLDYSVINVLKSEDRTRLGNKAFKRLGAILAALYPDYVLHRDLDLFCLKVDGAEAEMFQVENTSGKEHPIEYFLHPYLVGGAGTILFGAPGATKSYLGLLMAVSLDAGSSKLWQVARPRKVLFINLERSQQSVERRLAQVNRVLGLPIGRSIKMINARGKTLAAVSGAVARAVASQKIECIILDSLSRAGGDLNENREANGVMDTLNGFGGAWLVIGHSPRSDSTHVFGSVMFDAAADLTVQVTSERNLNVTGVMLKAIKFNDVAPGPPEFLSLRFDQDQRLATVQRAGSAQFAKLQSGGSPTDLRHMMEQVLPKIAGKGLTVQEIVTALADEGIEAKAGTVRALLSRHKEEGFKRGTQRRAEGKVIVWWTEDV